MTALDQLEERIDADVLERVSNGVCGCGCSTAITQGGNGRRRFVDQAHRQRHYRRKLRRLAEAEGVPARLSLKLVHASNSTDHRHGDAQNGRRKRQSKPRAGLSVYFPTVHDAELAQEWIDHLRRTDDAASTELDGAEAALERAIARHARKAAA